MSNKKNENKYSGCSCDEDDDTTAQSVMQATFKNSYLLDSNNGDDSDPLDSRNDYEGQSSSNQWDTFSSRAGLLGSASAALQTEAELQLKMYFQKDQDQHILKEVSNQIVHPVHFVYLLMSLCSVLF